MSIWFIYLCMGILFLVLEALISIDGYFIWLGMAALVTSLLAWFISELGGTGSVFLLNSDVSPSLRYPAEVSPVDDTC